MSKPRTSKGSGGAAWPSWKQSFECFGIPMLLNKGFHFLALPHEEAQLLVKRTNGPLAMYIERVGTGGQAYIQCTWMYITGNNPPSSCNMNTELWNAIMGGKDNSDLLLDARGLWFKEDIKNG